MTTYIEEYKNILTDNDCLEILDEINRRERYKDVVFWEDKNEEEKLIAFNKLFKEKTQNSVSQYLEKSAGLITYTHLHFAGFGLVTQPNGYYDGLHHDIETVINKDSVRIRAFVSLIYLNKEYEGGQLYFPIQKKVIEPEKGKLVIFPASYLFPHQVMHTAGNDRSFVRLHYLMNSDIKDEDLDVFYTKK